MDNEYITEEPGFSDESQAPVEGEQQESQAEETAKGDSEVAQLRKELEAKNAENAELKESERYWAGRNRETPQQGDAEAEPDEEPEVDEDPDAFAEALASEGVKALYKRGIPTKKEIVSLIQAESAKVASAILSRREAVITREAELLRDYPDLKNDKSDLYQETAQILREKFGDDPEFQRKPAALRVSAELADAKLKLRGESRSDRSLRIASQGGRPSVRNESSSDDLGPNERSIINAMSRYGVTEAGYRKQHQAMSKGRR